MRGAPTAGSSFHYDPVYDGISASLQHADLHGLSGCFSCFSIGQGLCRKLVAGNCVCWVEGVSGYELRVTGTSGCE